MLLRRLAHWCYRKRRVVVAGWLIALIGISVLGQTVGGDLLKTFSLPGSESQRAYDVLGADFQRKGDTGDLVFRVKGDGDVTAPEVAKELEPVFAELRKLPHVVSVTTPF